MASPDAVAAALQRAVWPRERGWRGRYDEHPGQGGPPGPGDPPPAAPQAQRNWADLNSWATPASWGEATGEALNAYNSASDEQRGQLAGALQNPEAWQSAAGRFGSMWSSASPETQQRFTATAQNPETWQSVLDAARTNPPRR